MPKLFLGNWKMYLADDEAVELCRAYVGAAKKARCEVAAAPSFTVLNRAAQAMKGSKAGLGAQDVFWEDMGAFTGEISAPALRGLGVTYVIIGHSERRQWLGETDETVAKKIRAALRAGLTPVICVGETLEEKNAGKRDEVVNRQMKSALSALAPDSTAVVAYEPRWAIGTGVPCEPADADEVHKMIWNLAAETLGEAFASRLRVLYGGSVDPGNIAGFVGLASVDGTLVGGASTDAGKALKMIEAFE